MPATTTRVNKASAALRERVPPVTALPLPSRLDRAVLALSAQGRASELAPLPEGSELKPVPGDFGLPLLGHTLEQMRYGTEFSLRRYDRYGPVSWSGGFGRRIVSFAGPEATQAVLTNRDKAFSQQGWAELIDRFFHRGLMLLDFGEHHAHRRIMQEAFTRDRLAGYVETFTPAVREGVSQWSTGRPMRLYWALKRLTLDVASQVFMGVRGDEEAERINRAFVGAVRAPTSIVRAPVPGGRWRAGLRGRKVLERYFADNLPARRAADAEGDDLFSALCHAVTPEGERFSDTDVINHMIFLMMAAHDTTTITSSAAAYYLAKHPEWQERARAESLALGDEPPDIEALESLHTLDLVIKEALRLVAPVPSLMRKTVADTSVVGHHIPAGTLCTVAPLINHFVPECWSNPFEFDPERFAEHRREDKSHRYAWLPFGGGVHKCIGMAFGQLEVKALLHEMLLRHRWSVPENYQMRWDYVSLPVPADGFPVRLRPGPRPHPAASNVR